MNLLANALHTSSRGPAMQVVAANTAFQHPTGYTSMKVASQEVEALFALTEIHNPRLFRVQLQPHVGKERPHQMQGRISLFPSFAQGHKVVSETHQLPMTAAHPGPIQCVQKDV